MVSNGVTLTDGTHTVTLTIVSNVEATPSVNVAEIPIPGRFTGGQVQVIAAPQWKYSVTGILNDRAGTGGAGTAHTDDENDFEEGGYLELIKNNTAADCTFTQYYNGTTIRTVTTRLLEFPSWPIKGSTMNWWGFSLKLLRKQ
jgi:hypothetical protein